MASPSLRPPPRARDSSGRLARARLHLPARRQGVTLLAIHELCCSTGRVPLLLDVSRALGCRGKDGAKSNVSGLRGKGYLAADSLSLTDLGKSWVCARMVELHPGTCSLYPATPQP